MTKTLYPSSEVSMLTTINTLTDDNPCKIHLHTGEATLCIAVLALFQVTVSEVLIVLD